MTYTPEELRDAARRLRMYAEQNEHSFPMAAEAFACAAEVIRVMDAACITPAIAPKHGFAAALASVKLADAQRAAEDKLFAHEFASGATVSVSGDAEADTEPPPPARNQLDGLSGEALRQAVVGRARDPKPRKGKR